MLYLIIPRNAVQCQWNFWTVFSGHIFEMMTLTTHRPGSNYRNEVIAATPDDVPKYNADEEVEMLI